MAKSAYEQTGVDLPDPEPVQPRPAPEPERDVPDWVPSKFQTGQAFAESYTHLEQRLTEEARARQEAEEYAQAMAEQLELTAEQQQQPQQPQTASGLDPNHPLVLQYQNAVEQAMSGDARDLMALNLFQMSQLLEQRQQEQAGQQQAPDPVTNQLFARIASADAKEAYEAKYNEPWEVIAPQAGQFLQQNLHWLAGVENDPQEAARRVLQAADYVRSTGIAQEQGGNPNGNGYNPGRAKMLGQSLHGSGARTQASQDAADALVEQMKNLSRPYGYNGV